MKVYSALYFIISSGHSYRGIAKSNRSVRSSRGHEELLQTLRKFNLLDWRCIYYALVLDLKCFTTLPTRMWLLTINFLNDVFTIVVSRWFAHLEYTVVIIINRCLKTRGESYSYLLSGTLSGTKWTEALGCRHYSTSHKIDCCGHMMRMMVLSSYSMHMTERSS